MAIKGSLLRYNRPCSRSPALTVQPKRHSVETHSLRYMHGCKLIGIGSSIPETVVTNFDLEKIVETSDEWITQRTGIKQRRVLKSEEKLGDRAIDASKKAIEMANISPNEIDCIIFATSTPDDIFGSACQVQHGLNANHAVAFDLTSACSGFVLALVTAAQYIRSGTFQRIVVVGGDGLSRFVDWRDRCRTFLSKDVCFIGHVATCILFGDGCGAVVMTNENEGDSCSLLGMSMISDGGGYNHLHASMKNGDLTKALGDNETAKGLSSYHNITMNGQEVYKWAVRGIPQVLKKALNNAQLSQDEIDWLVMHQANQRIMDATATRLGIPAEKVVSNLSKYGNTSAASIPLVMDECIREGEIKPGNLLALAGFGAGLTMAAAIVRWK